MCVHFRQSPLFAPYKYTALPNGLHIAEGTLLLGKGVKKGNDGIHETRIDFPIQRWVTDPNFRGDHENTIHMAPPEPVFKGELKSYGDHRLLLMPSENLYSSKDNGGRCWHDGQVYVAGCIDCDGIEMEELSDEDVMKELMSVKPGFRSYPNGKRLIESPFDGPLFKQKFVFSPN